MSRRQFLVDVLRVPHSTMCVCMRLDVKVYLCVAHHTSDVVI